MRREREKQDGKGWFSLKREHRRQTTLKRPPHQRLYAVGESKLANPLHPNGLKSLPILANTEAG